MGSVISSDVRAWVRPGLPGALAIAGTGAIEVVRLWGLRFLEASDVLEALVQRSAATRALALLGDGSRAAFNVIEIPTYRSRTFKGFCTLGEGEIDHAFVASSLDALQRGFSSVGMAPDSVVRMMGHADSPELVSLRMKVEAVFDQTPKRGAGQAL